MVKALFYHLTQNPAEVTARMLLARALQNGWRVTLRGGDAGRLEWLDQALWLGDKASFLPHGLAGGPHDADQPILLTTGRDCPNDPACLMLVDKAEADAGELAGLERLWVLFDGQDQEALAHARTQWKALTGAGVVAEYWSEDSGRWQKKAQSGG